MAKEMPITSTQLHPNQAILCYEIEEVTPPPTAPLNIRCYSVSMQKLSRIANLILSAFDTKNL